MILQQLPIADPDTINQVADSLRNASQQFVTILKDDPQTAMNILLQDALQFGIKVLAALAIYIVGIWLIKKVKRMLSRSFERKHTDKTIASFTNSLVSVCLTVLVIVLAVGTLGINTTSLAALLAAGGMAIGMALSGTLQNFAGGIMLLIFKPFKAGDFIEAQSYSGTVNEVNIVSTKLTTTDNKVIVIPNGALSAGTINNFSQRALRRVDFSLPMSHESKVDEVIGTLESYILGSTDSRLLKEGDLPEAQNPAIVLNKIDINSLEIVVKIWVRSEDYWDVFYEYNRNFCTLLSSAGFEFAANRVDISNKS
ncbi:MAG: mechanosensitive ion channel family protein [Candidatus Cryptobacteroides sp.]